MMKSLEEISLSKGEYGGGFSAVDYFEGAPRYIRITDITDGGKLNELVKAPSGESNEWGKYKLKEGDILFARTGATVGKTFLYNDSYGDCIYAGYLIRFRPNLKISFPKYVYYYTKTPEYFSWVEMKQNVVAQPNINARQYGTELQIPLPPLEQQKKIAAILDAADELRQKDKALIAKYDELTHAMFLDMFGDPVSNPKGWKVNNLKNLSTKIHSGNTPKGGSEVYVENGITFFRSQNVWKNSIVYEDVAFIDKEIHAKMMKSSLKHRDILMTKTGRINTENSSLGRAAMYLGQDDKANVNGHVYLIRLKEGIINEFVLHILTTKEYREHIRRVCVGGIDKRQLNKDHLEEFPIISPPLEMQEKFVNSLLLIQSQKDNLKATLQKSENLFNSLLQKAFSGELTNF